MEFILITIGLFVIASYTILIITFIRGWQLCNAGHICEDLNLPELSCIIALRNESDTVSKLIKNLNLLEYPKGKVEFIFIDDNSTDDTFLKLQKLEQHFNYKLTLTKSNGVGKKVAIAQAITLATNEHIVLTDADCTPHKNWLLSIGSCFINKKSDMIAAPVFIKPNTSFLSYFQSIDFISLITSTAGAIGINKPIMCNGANLAYKKQQYLNVNDQLKEEFLSGDDVFLLHAIKRSGGKVTFLKDKNSIVHTEPEKDIKSFLNQRVRWASKSKGYSDNFTLLTAWLVFLSNLLVVSAIPFVNIYSTYSICILIAWFLKVMVDANIIYKGIRFFGLQNRYLYSVLTFLIYPIYIAVTVVWAAFGVTNWRDRMIK